MTSSAWASDFSSLNEVEKKDPIMGELIKKHKKADGPLKKDIYIKILLEQIKIDRKTINDLKIVNSVQKIDIDRFQAEAIKEEREIKIIKIKAGSIGFGIAIDIGLKAILGKLMYDAISIR